MRSFVRERSHLYAALREFFRRQAYVEVETPSLVRFAGMEPQIRPFEVWFHPEMKFGEPRRWYLHTSPEYAMKRLLGEGFGAIFQLGKVFRNGEISRLHNPEFSLLEFYRPDADYRVIMAELESALSEGCVRVGRDLFFSRLPYQRVTVHQAVKQYAEIDLAECPDVTSLRAAALSRSIHIGEATTFEDLFFHIFLQRVEPNLGNARPTFLVDYPASMASLSRLKPGDSTLAERFELYAKGTELANGFSELTDVSEQRRRLIEEQAWRQAHGKEPIELDELFLKGVAQMPPSAGVAVGIDRVLMLMVGASSIDEVLLFPASQFQ